MRIKRMDFFAAQGARRRHSFAYGNDEQRRQAKKDAVLCNAISVSQRRGRAELIDEMIASNAIAHGLDDPNDTKGNEVRRQEEFKKFHHSFRSAFPDIRISIEEMVSEGDLVVGYCKIKATHKGAGFGMESSSKLVAFKGMLMFRARVGKVVEAWNGFDFLKMFQQMGVVKLAGV